MAANFIKVSIIYFIIGIGLGLYMGAVEEFQFTHAHAHINLLGWVSLALSGLIFKAYPVLAKNKLAMIHFWGFMVGIPLLTFGMFLFGLNRFDIGIPISGVGGALITLGLLAFAVNVFANVKDN